MSKSLGHREEYDIARKSAKQKIEKGLELKSSEICANDGRWFFTMAIEIETFDKIIELAEKYSVKPWQIAEAFILKGLNNV